MRPRLPHVLYFLAACLLRPVVADSAANPAANSAANLEPQSSFMLPTDGAVSELLDISIEISRTILINNSWPVYAIIGLQSSGKTSLLNSLAGFTVGYHDPRTGTRCPVRAHTHASP
jgi:hypothetical protein